MIANIIGTNQPKRGSSSIPIEFTISYGNIRFDLNRVYGYDLPIGGDIQIDVTGAVDTNQVLIYHQDNVIPIISVIGGGYTINTTGTYIPNVLHHIYISKVGTIITVQIKAQV